MSLHLNRILLQEFVKPAGKFLSEVFIRTPLEHQVLWKHQTSIFTVTFHNQEVGNWNRRQGIQEVRVDILLKWASTRNLKPFQFHFVYQLFKQSHAKPFQFFGLLSDTNVEQAGASIQLGAEAAKCISKISNSGEEVHDQHSGKLVQLNLAEDFAKDFLRSRASKLTMLCCSRDVIA